MASKKEGGKNKKFGRHTRNPSSNQQASRTARNKARRIEAAHKRGDKMAGVSVKHPKQHVDVRPPLPVPMSSILSHKPGPHWLVEVARCVVVEFTNKFAQAADAFHRSMHPDTRVFKLDEFARRIPVNMTSPAPKREQRVA